MGGRSLRTPITAAAIVVAGIVTWVGQPRPDGLTVTTESLRYPITIVGFLIVIYILGTGHIPRLAWPWRDRRPDLTRIGQSFRASVERANVEAVQLDHNYIGTEHLLLGLLGDPGSAVGRLLAEEGVELAATRAKLEAEIGRGTEPVSGEIGLTRRSKRAIVAAIGRARKSGDHALAEDNHLLQGLLDVPDGLAVGLLIESGCNVVDLRRKVARLRP
jgi:Clp amino terminal domain, pathogenicity island component